MATICDKCGAEAKEILYIIKYNSWCRDTHEAVDACKDCAKDFKKKKEAFIENWKKGN